jgi:phosphomevalonate kinase
LITVLADNDYYSQPGTSSASSTSSKQFLDFGVRLQDAHKTGLGSSAALVTAFTGAVLSHYLTEAQFSISSKEGHARLHNLAQAAHCAAQGKVGSGFDVAAAVYGTCIYRRFSPSILASVGEPGSVEFAARLQKSVEDTNPENKWDTEVAKGTVDIPKGMALIMCDVDCGSQTVGMVKKVLEWRKQDPSGAKILWDQLQAENESLAKQLLTGSPTELGQAMSGIRKHIRDMGTRSGVPIEPEEQTALLDAVTGGVDGVYGGVVPGAGGYDAVVLLVKDDDATITDVKAFLSEWSASKQSNVKLLGVKGEMEGVREEDGAIYGAWIK